MFLFISIAKYIVSITAMEIISSKTYFSLLYELFKKKKFQKSPKNETGLNVLRIIIHLS